MPEKVRKPRVRGFTLIEVIAMLPLVAMIFGLVYYVSIRSIEYQTLELSDQRDRTAMRDIVRRVQDEVALAGEAVIEAEDLQLRFADGRSVTYGADAGTVVRVERSEEGRQIAKYEWAMKRVRTSFSLEPREGAAPIVWMRFERSAPRSRGPEQTMILSAAAAVGRGS